MTTATVNSIDILPARHPDHPVSKTGVDAELINAAHGDARAVLQDLASSTAGLTSAQAAQRLATTGPNEVVHRRGSDRAARLLKTVRNPLAILLTLLAAVSFAAGDPKAGTVMSLILATSLALRLIQEGRADRAAQRLKAMIHVTATAVRDGRPVEVPVHDLVPGDVVQLSAGDMIPADVRLIVAKDLFVNQSSLTGESLPVEKHCDPDLTTANPLEFANVGFMGSSVESGAATAVVVVTGRRTHFGGMAASLLQAEGRTAFDRGVDRFTWFMIRLALVMVPLVFLINGLTKHDWRGAFFFAIAVAVGLTPEMLPMIVSVCLAKGALAMSRRKVIVRRLDAIQDFGAMDVLCTDKTGTLTLDRVILQRHCDVAGDESDDVLLHGYLISHFQTGLRNVLDRATLECPDFHAHALVESYRKLDEIPFDLARRMMSVVVEAPDGRVLLLTKGAPEEVIARCDRFELDGAVSPIDPVLLADLKEEYESLSSDGFRVLAVACRELPRQPAYGKEAERGLVLKGYVAFLDPPKQSAAPAILALQRHGITVKVLTGDNPLVAQKVCAEVGLAAPAILLGHEIEAMSDADLADAAGRTTLFARVSPDDKRRVIRALQTRGHVVGFLGDGINDAPALRAADVGVSVDTAVDIAKGSASVILLEKSLMVLDEGVIEGRKVFANILKYIRMGASSNFGNMLSVLGASAFLPFLPMTPILVLTNNLLYDLSQTAIPTDNVDPEELLAPRPWQIGDIRRFILTMGPVSSIFDYVTFFLMLWLLDCWSPARAAVFQTGWFVESLVTQTLIIHVIRTTKIPFLQSRASWPLMLTSLLVVSAALLLPYSPFAAWLGLASLPLLYWFILAAAAIGYLGLGQAAKTWFRRSPRAISRATLNSNA